MTIAISEDFSKNYKYLLTIGLKAFQVLRLNTILAFLR